MRGMSPAGWFDYKGKANYQSFIVVIDRTVFLISTTAIIFFLRNENVIIIISVAQLIARMITLIMEWRYVALTADLIKKPVYSFVKKLMGVNAWVWFGGIGNLLMTQANQLMLNSKFGPKELALYGFSFQITLIIRLLQQQILRLITPSIAVVTENVRENAGIIKKKLLNFCILNILLSLAILIPTYFLVPYVIVHFISKDFLGALPVLNILYIWILLFGVAIIINQFLIGLQLQRLFFISTTIFGLLSLLLASVFINEYGAKGAALSLLISHLCSVIFQLWVILRKINQEVNVKISTE
jgi:O-antigen/teichoic acid export membrane protein